MARQKDTPPTTTRRTRRMARTTAADETPVTLEPAAPASPGRKITHLLALLDRDKGATLAELTAATGWLPHSTRAALTGLRKKGHAVDRSKRDGETCYRIGSAV